MLRVVVFLIVSVLLFVGAAAAQTAPQATSEAAAPPPHPGYDAEEAWLCRPERDDACAVDQDSTVVRADGTLERVEWPGPDPDAPIDCFYVYPTVSLDATTFSDMVAGPEERRVVELQAARFVQRCRLYAPLYRQRTLTALRAMMAGQAADVSPELSYGDVLDAWNHYLEYDNGGRGVVLIGHSQGSHMLSMLIAREIDPKPDVRAKIVSAMLLGWPVAVPPGEEVGGTFQNMPLCRSAQQTGCIVSYASFRSDVPPSQGSRFARPRDDGSMAAACTNPSSLTGDEGSLNAFFPTVGLSSTYSNEPPTWVTPAQEITTPFVQLPGMITAQCVSNERGSYLEVTVHADPNDPRADDIIGDVVVNGVVSPMWGLHLVDVSLAQGNLLDLMAAQARAYLDR